MSQRTFVDLPGVASAAGLLSTEDDVLVFKWVPTFRPTVFSGCSGFPAAHQQRQGWFDA
jgi:hypothetical protein